MSEYSKNVQEFLKSIKPVHYTYNKKLFKKILLSDKFDFKYYKDIAEKIDISEYYLYKIIDGSKLLDDNLINKLNKYLHERLELKK